MCGFEFRANQLMRSCHSNWLLKLNVLVCAALVYENESQARCKTRGAQRSRSPTNSLPEVHGALFLDSFGKNPTNNLILGKSQDASCPDAQGFWDKQWVGGYQCSM